MRFHYALAAAASLAVMPATAHAATVLDGIVSSISYRDHDNGLVIFADNFSPFNFSLDLDPATATPSSRTVDLFRIGTQEGSVGLDDIFSYDITVNFLFNNPTDVAGPPIEGYTRGRAIFQDGIVRWDNSDPYVFNFGDTGSFSIKLSDVNFGTPGSAIVKGKFTLESLPSAVPEPSTWALMILGFGAIGGAMRSKRKQPQQLRLSYS